MSPRERMLAAAILLVIVLAGAGFLFSQLFLGPLHERDANLAALQQEIDAKRDRVATVVAERPKLEHWRQLSLPADIVLAQREYEKYLYQLFHKSGFAVGSFSITPRPPETVGARPADANGSPTAAGKGTVYTRLGFSVTASGDLANLVRALEQFYRTGLLHEVKSLAIQRGATSGSPQQPAGSLTANLTIEALVISGAANRPTLLAGPDRRLLALEAAAGLCGGPAGLALVPWAVGPTGPLGPRRLAQPPRSYAAIAAKNIFTGSAVSSAPDPDVAQFVYLNEITRNGRGCAALLYNHSNRTEIRLRPVAGSDHFRIQNQYGELRVEGKVVCIEDRDLIFQSGERYYSVHVGQSLADALRTPLTGEQVKTLRLTMRSEKTDMP